MVECKQCPPNTYSTESSGLCTACPQGSQANENRAQCVSCESLPSSWRQITTKSQFPLAPGSEVALVCSTGHTLTGASTVTCIEEDDFSFNEEPSCVLDECSKLPNIQNLGTTTRFPVPYDTRVRVHCDTGYSLVGGDVIICIRDDNYQSIDGKLPSCEEKYCSGVPPDISHLKSSTIFPVSYGIVVSVSCSEDKELRGDEVITCNQGVHFDFQEKPKCNDGGTCTELPIGGHLKTDSVFPVKKGAKIFVNCVEGFTLTSGDRTITCVQDADYVSSNQLPTCIIEKCTELPNIFDLTTSTSLPVDHGTIVEMDCIPGYSLSGSRLITCIKDKDWSFSDSPKCILDTCTELPAAVSDMTTTSTFPVLVGTVVEVNCKSGHTLAGDNSITCIRDVSFTIGQRPTCTIDRCTGMMIENYLSTAATFPITYGTVNLSTH